LAKQFATDTVLVKAVKKQFDLSQSQTASRPLLINHTMTNNWEDRR